MVQITPGGKNIFFIGAYYYTFLKEGGVLFGKVLLIEGASTVSIWLKNALEKNIIISYLIWKLCILWRNLVKTIEIWRFVKNPKKKKVKFLYFYASHSKYKDNLFVPTEKWTWNSTYIIYIHSGLSVNLEICKKETPWSNLLLGNCPLSNDKD